MDKSHIYQDSCFVLLEYSICKFSLAGRDTEQLKCSKNVNSSFDQKRTCWWLYSRYLFHVWKIQRFHNVSSRLAWESIFHLAQRMKNQSWFILRKPVVHCLVKSYLLDVLRVQFLLFNLYRQLHGPASVIHKHLDSIRWPVPIPSSWQQLFIDSSDVLYPLQLHLQQVAPDLVQALKQNRTR